MGNPMACELCGRPLDGSSRRGPARQYHEPCRRLRSHLGEVRRILTSGAIAIAPGKPGAEFRKALRKLVLGVANLVPPAEPWNERDASGRFLPKERP